MSGTEMVVAIVLFLVVGDIAVTAIVARSRAYRVNAKLEEVTRGIESRWHERLDKMERWMGNLETIVLEQEKHREFDRSF